MKAIILILVIGLTTSCGFLKLTGGAGSIKSYQYSVTKYELEKAVNKVIENNISLYRPSLKNQPFSGDYYNKDGYVTLKIFQPDTVEYTFRYYNNEEYWKISKSSGIFIAYAYNNKGQGGCEGYNSFRFKKRLRKEFTNEFETEFINKVDAELGLKHIDTK